MILRETELLSDVTCLCAREYMLTGHCRMCVVPLLCFTSRPETPAPDLAVPRRGAKELSDADASMRSAARRARIRRILLEA
jgi:hypothetical protein